MEREREANWQLRWLSASTRKGRLHSALVNKSQLTSVEQVANEFHLPKEHWVVNVMLWCTTNVPIMSYYMFYNSEYSGHLIDVIGSNTLQ